VEDIEAPVVVEIPLISHGLGDEWRRIVVDCRDDVRLERAVSRGMDETDARARMNAQPARSEWLAVADVVVPNHRTVDELQAAVARLVPLL
jgi:dephospho-CoA kinase